MKYRQLVHNVLVASARVASEYARVIVLHGLTESAALRELVEARAALDERLRNNRINRKIHGGTYRGTYR